MRRCIFCVLILFFALVTKSYPLVYLSGKDGNISKEIQNKIKIRSHVENNNSTLNNKKSSVSIQRNETVRIRKR